MFFVVLAMFVLSVALFIFDITALVGADKAMRPEPAFGMPLVIFMIILFVAACFLSNSFFSLQSGQARVCVLFGKYVDTVNDEGLRWANPLYAKNLGLVEAGLDSEKPGACRHCLQERAWLCHLDASSDLER
jgi:regulator of protease activity HflC (stomatin/prohibitin superfamily)